MFSLKPPAIYSPRFSHTSRGVPGETVGAVAFVFAEFPHVTLDSRQRALVVLVVVTREKGANINDNRKSEIALDCFFFCCGVSFPPREA